MRDGFQMVARTPYPVTIPKYFAVASEVATMDYIFMEISEGTSLSVIWFDPR